MKRLISVFIILTIVFSSIFPVFAAQSSSDPNVKLCVELGLLQGGSGGIDDSYLDKSPTKLQAAVLFLKLKGLEHIAKEYKGASNYIDAESASWAKSYMLYIKENPNLAFPSSFGEAFEPNSNINSNYYYAVLLTALGYKVNTPDKMGDFSLSDATSYAQYIGLKTIEDQGRFTMRELAAATVEALNAIPKGEKEALLNRYKKYIGSTHSSSLSLDNLQVLSAKAVSSRQVEVKFNESFGVAVLDKNIYGILEKTTSTELNIISVIQDTDNSVLIQTEPQKSNAEYTLSILKEVISFKGKAESKQTPEIVDKVLCLDTDLLEIRFNTPMDRESAEEESNYIANNGLTVVEATLDTSKDAERKTVRLKTEGMRGSKGYRLNIENVLSADLVKMNSVEKSFTGVADTKPPKISGEIEVVNNQRIRVRFNDAHGIDKESAEEISNWNITSGEQNLSIHSIAAIDDDKDILGYLDMVELETEPMTQGREYKLSVSNIADNSIAKNTMPKTISSSFMGVYADKTKPYVSKITVLDDYRIAVDFTENNRMDISSMTSGGNYVIDKNIDVTSVREYGVIGDPKSVILETSGLEKKTYKLTIENISDEFGNTISKTTQSITGKEADQKPPYITKTNWVNDETVELFFSEKVEPTQAENPSNYLLDGSQGKVKRAKLAILGDTCKVILTTVSQQPNTTYAIVISGISDMAGNEMSNAKEYFVSRGTASDIGETAIESIYAVSSQEVQVVFNKAMRVDKTSLPTMTLAGGAVLKFSGELLDGGTKAVFTPSSSKAINDVNKEYTVDKISDIKDINDKAFAIEGTKPTFTGNDSENTPAKVKFIDQVDYSTIRIKFDEPIKFSSLTWGDTASIKAQKGNSFSAYIDYKEEDTNDAEATLTLKHSGKLSTNNEIIFNLRAALAKGGYIQDYSGNLVNNSTTWDTTSITPYVEDKEGPKIQSVEAIDSTSFKVIYDEPISKNYPGSYSIYKITSSGGTSQVVTGTAKVDTKDDSIVIVTFNSTNIKEDESYVVKPTSGARDIAGNSASTSGIVFDYIPSYTTDSDYIKGVAIIDSKVIKVMTKKPHTVGDKIRVLDERGLNMIDISKNGDGITSGIKGSGTDQLTIYLAMPLLKMTSYKVDISSGKLTYNFTYDSDTSGENPVFIGEVKATPAPGLIELKKTVALSTDTEGAEIRYTIDGTDPNLTSPKYTGPIVINSEVTIKAIAVKVGAVSSGIAEFEYTLKPDSIPPVLTGVTTGNVTIGDNISATSNEDGYIYLVPSTVTKNWTAIEAAGNAANGTYALATPNASINLSTTGFAAGKYIVYAVDPLYNISEPSAVITVREPLKAAPELIPTVATVDGDFGISFIDDAAWRGKISAVKMDGITLEAAKDYTIAAGGILFKPSGNMLMQRPGEKEITVEAEGYNTASVTQDIKHGTVSKLMIEKQPVAPSEDRQEFSTQPVIKLQDKYGNTCVGDSTTEVIAARADNGVWTLKGTLLNGKVAVKANKGIATFMDLSTQNFGEAIAGAKIKFSVGEITVDSAEFIVPKAVMDAPTVDEPVDATVDAAFDIELVGGDNSLWRGAIKAIKVNGVSIPSGAYEKSIPGKITIRPSMDASLQTAGIKSIVIEATGYVAKAISVDMKHGAAKKIVVLTQPQTPPGGDKILKVQPILKLQDQYGNDCTTNTTTKITVSKADIGSWVLGSINGSLEATAVNGIVTFSGLTADRSIQISGAKLSFSGAGVTGVESAAFNIVAPTLPAAPTLTPADGATVDDDIQITFASNAAWKAAIKSIKVNGVNLDVAAFIKNDSNITLKPSESTLLQSAGTKTIIIEAEGYAMASMSQSIGHGAAKEIVVTVQPKAPAINGTVLSVQPKVKLLDQYGNDCTTDSTTEITAQADNGWTIGGIKKVKAINGLVTFISLTAGNTAPLGDAKITFSSGTLSATSISFAIPAPITSGNETAVITSPANGSYVKDDITLIEGTTGPNTDSNKTTNIKVSIKDGSGRYLTKNENGIFINPSPTYLNVVPKAAGDFSEWTVTLSGVAFGNGSYTIEAIAFDGENGPTATSVFTTKMSPPDGITISAQNTILPNGSVTLTVKNGPLSNDSWIAIRDQIKNNIAGGDNWITGILKGELLLTPSEDGKTATLKNTNSTNAAMMVKDFTIANTKVVDRAGNVALADIVIDANAEPGIVNNVTATNDDGSYKAGQIINIVVTYSSAVTVSGGTPRIKMSTGNTVDAYAKYVGGSNTTDLKFTYTVQPGDNIADLNYAVGSIDANGATIKNKLPAIDAVLTLPAIGGSSSLGGNKDIILDTIVPYNIKIDKQNVIPGNGSIALTVEGGPLADNSWKAILNQIKANTTGGENWILGIPADKLAIEPSAAGDTAVLKNNNGSNAVIMKDFTILSSNIYDRASNNAASNLTIDSYIETASVVSVNAGVTNGTYNTGEMSITVTFTDYVTVAGGVPYLLLNTGGVGSQATYDSGSGTNTLVFKYTVQPGHNTAKLDYVAVDSLVLNGGKIDCISPAGLAANIMLPTPGTTGSLGANRAIVIDTQAPQFDVNSGAVLSTDHKKVTLTFSEKVLNNSADLKTAVTYSSDGTTFAALEASDSVAIVDGRLVISFATALTTENNKIRIAISTLKDAVGNINGSAITTNAINAAADITPPALISAVVNSISPNKVVLTFDEALDSSSTPAKTDFALGGAGERTITVVQISGNTVNLTLSSPLSNGISLTINYVKGINPIKDLYGNAVQSINTSISNSVDAAAKVTGISVDGVAADKWYKAGAEISINVAFDKEVNVTGVPKLQLRMGASTVDAMYESGNGTATLKFKYIVATGHNTNNLEYASTGALLPNGGSIKNKDTEVNAVLTLPAPSQLGGIHKIVVDTIVPTLASAVVENGMKDELLLTYSEELKSASLNKSDFDIAVVDRTGITVDAASISGKVVTLKLSQDLSAGNVITVSYLPGILSDEADNKVAAFANKAVTNSIVDNIAPEMALGYPAVEGKDTSAILKTKSNEAGKVYFVVLPKGAAAPTPVQVRDGKNAAGTAVATNMKGNADITANTEKVINISGLSLSTEYDLYAVCEDKATPKNLQTLVSNVQFATTPLDLSGVTINVAEGKINGTTAAMQYSLNSTDGTNGTWYDCSAGSTANVSFIPGKVYVREKARTTNSKDIGTVEDQTAPDVSGVNYNIELGEITGISNMQYKIGAGDWIDSGAAGKALGVVFTQGALSIRLKATQYKLPSSPTVKVTIQAPAAAPNLYYDDNANTIPGLNATYEYKIGSAGIWIPGNILGDFSGDKSVMVRVKATETTLPSMDQTINFKADMDLSVVGIDIAAKEITGTNTNMQYRLNKADGTVGEWKACTSGSTKNVDFIAGDVYVRDKNNPTNYKKVIKVLDAPAANAVELSIILSSNPYLGTIKNNAGINLQYRIDGGIWNDLNNGQTTAQLVFASGRLEIRKKLDEKTETSLVRLIAPEPAPTGITATITDDTATLNNVDNSFEYSIDGGVSWSQYASGIPIAIYPSSDLRVRKKATAITLPSDKTEKLN